MSGNLDDVGRMVFAEDFRVFAEAGERERVSLRAGTACADTVARDGACGT